jgi:hypothetical protein
VSDELDSIGVSAVEPDAGPGAAARGGAAKGTGFFSSTLGRLLLIGCAVSVVLGIIGVAVVLVLGMFAAKTVSDTLSNAPASVTSVPTGGTGAETSGGAGAMSLVPTEPPAVPTIATRDIFTPRDPFEEIKPPVIPTETVKVDQDVLVLKDIITEDGVRKGVFTYNGVQYVGGAGDVLGTTNWKVLAVHDSSADVLFGDDRVTLSVGQGIQK